MNDPVSPVTRTQFSTALRQCLKEDFPWAADDTKLNNFMASVQTTLEGRKTVIIDGKSFQRAWRSCGLKGKPTYKGLHALLP